MRPCIKIDREALRFTYEGGGTNLFWDEVFSPRTHRSFQREVMLLLKRLYDECVEKDIRPEDAQVEYEGGRICPGGG